ncbi:MAG: hypothetical protein JSS70_14765 [Bacteroidetes bacterium]|nr:hypothetical protein [Bacteroidota bacterium]
MKIDLIDHKELKDFPSGSGIEYFDGRIYIVGDDAANILVTNKRWAPRHSIKLFESAGKRISKKQKADLEATTLLQIDGMNYLLVMGSGSAEPRNTAIILDIKTEKFKTFDTSVFYTRLKEKGIMDLNIEGAVQVHEFLVLCNRANNTNPVNQLIITSPDFFRRQEEAPIDLLDVDLSAWEGIIGISGLTYSYEHDQLIFTTSNENTANSYEDGPIGTSYLGIVENGYRKIWRHKMKVNELIDLPGTYKEFKGHKVESVCIQSERTRSIKMHIVADDDSGESFLFKVRLRF